MTWTQIRSWRFGEDPFEWVQARAVPARSRCAVLSWVSLVAGCAALSVVDGVCRVLSRIMNPTVSPAALGSCIILLVVASGYESQRKPSRRRRRIPRRLCEVARPRLPFRLLQKAVRLLRASELGAAYEDAWTEWVESDDGDLWEAATADGLADAAWRDPLGRPRPGARSRVEQAPAGSDLVSNDGANATASRLGRGVVTVVPVTSSTDRVYPFQVLLVAEQTGLSRDSKAQAEQVRSVAVERIGARVGALSATDLARVDRLRTTPPALRRQRRHSLPQRRLMARKSAPVTRSWTMLRP